MVKIKNRPGLVTSCTTEVMEGMEVITEDEQINNMRRLIVELILSEHEHNCLICEKHGDCQLQDLAYRLRIDKISFPVEKTIQPVDDSSEVILRDYHK